MNAFSFFEACDSLKDLLLANRISMHAHLSAIWHLRDLFDAQPLSEREAAHGSKRIVSEDEAPTRIVIAQKFERSLVFNMPAMEGALERAKAAKLIEPKAPTAESLGITQKSLDVFIMYAGDAANWSGNPLIGGNVGGSKSERGNLTQLKMVGLITTQLDEGCTWLYFTAAGRELAAALNIELN
jgi:hypothetical protein